MKNIEQRVCGRRIYTFLVVCLVALMNLSGYASVKVHVQYLTTADGLSNNSVRYIYQDSKGFIWMSSLNGLNRYDGNSFRTFLPKNNGRISLADRRVKHLYEDNNGFLWISTSADRFSCYDLKKDCFVDFTGCGEHEDLYGYMTKSGYGDGGKAVGVYNIEKASLFRKSLMRKVDNSNRTISCLCCRIAVNGCGLARIEDFIIGKVMRCSVLISHIISSVPIVLKTKPAL